MADYFAILGQPRRPALDADQLKQEFLRLSAELHPDKASPENRAAAEKDFRELNAAYNCLRETRPRLLHLLELEGVPAAPHVQSAPADVMEFFAPVAGLTRGVDEFLRRKRNAGSPMLQAQLFEEGLDWTDRIQALQARLRRQITFLEEELDRDREDKKDEPGPISLDRLGQIAAILGFYERWSAQLQERLTALSF